MDYKCFKARGIEMIYVKGKENYYDEHNHTSTYTLGIVLKGKLTLVKEKKRLEIKVGEAFFINLYEPHLLKGDGFCEWLSISIKEEEIKEHTMEEIRERLFVMLHEAGLIEREVERSQLAAALEKVYCEGYAQPIDEPIKEVENYYITCEQRQLRIEELAKKISYSKFHLIRKFKKQIGLTPHQFQIQARVRKAQRLLEKGSDLSEVAYLTGFYDQSHFNRCFKHIVGITPSEYIKSVKHIDD